MPSSEAEKRTLPCFANATEDMGALWSEGDEAESRIGGPDFDLAVITARCYGLTIRCVCKSVHAEIVSSLLENV